MTIVALSAIPAGPSLTSVPSGPVIASIGTPSVGGVSDSTAIASVDGRVAAGTIGGNSLPQAIVLPVRTAVSQDGILSLDVTDANTILVSVFETISTIAFVGFPDEGLSERVTVYFQQDALGGHAIGGWSSQVKWASGLPPHFSAEPNSTDCVVFDSTNGGAMIFGNLVGLNYA